MSWPGKEWIPWGASVVLALVLVVAHLCGILGHVVMFVFGVCLIRSLIFLALLLRKDLEDLEI
jgi:hypothetical protein